MFRRVRLKYNVSPNKEVIGLVKEHIVLRSSESVNEPPAILRLDSVTVPKIHVQWCQYLVDILKRMKANRCKLGSMK